VGVAAPSKVTCSGRRVGWLLGIIVMSIMLRMMEGTSPLIPHWVLVRTRSMWTAMVMGMLMLLMLLWLKVRVSYRLMVVMSSSVHVTRQSSIHVSTSWMLLSRMSTVGAGPELVSLAMASVVVGIGYMETGAMVVAFRTNVETWIVITAVSLLMLWLIGV
jgi:hypothetical protein